MDAMTPEERFTRIENSLATTAEHLATHRQVIEKQNAGIRDLIVVCRTLLDSHQELVDSHQQTISEIRELRESVNILVTTVDRIIRNQKN